MEWLYLGLWHAALMGWETFWALVFGFAVSAALQTFVSRPQMGRLFGRVTFKSVAMATGFGAASSSCSYAAAASARSAFRQGAALIPSLAFMFASTNLVAELGAVLWILMGWRFVLAEAVGAFVLIGLMWIFARLLFPPDLESSSRLFVDTNQAGTDEGGCHHHDHHEHGNRRDSPHRTVPWQQLGSAFVMDWQMLWKEIMLGFLIAGFLSVLVPPSVWKSLFLTTGPSSLRLVENAAVGPIIAVASFVCSVGNLPLASLLWSDGISFGGVISFIYGDLLIIPLILIYRKAFGARTAGYITAVLYLSMVVAGLLVDLLFSACGWIPTGARHPSSMATMQFRWNYTTWLDLLAVLVGVALWRLHAVSPKPNPPEACTE